MLQLLGLFAFVSIGLLLIDRSLFKDGVGLALLLGDSEVNVVTQKWS
jgi:hypothetical protein